MINPYKKYELYFIVFLVGFVIGVISSLKVPYPVTPRDIRKAHNFCSATPDDEITAVEVNFRGVITEITCKDGLSYKTN